MPKKQKSIPSAKLLAGVDKALNALEKSLQSAKTQVKNDKKAIAALLELEAQIEDSGTCKCSKKKKKKKTAKKSKQQSKNIPQIHEVSAVSNILELPHKSKVEADDLELIAGVGPKLAETLNSLGVHTFEQIANWQESDVERIDTHLNFSGRIARENWIEQAKALAIGGRDEYVKVFGKEPR